MIARSLAVPGITPAPLALQHPPSERGLCGGRGENSAVLLINQVWKKL